MNKSLACSLMQLATLVVTAACSLHVIASEDLAKKNACLTCHGVSKKIVGPAFADIAQKYNAAKTDADVLAKSIKAGGSGKWGAVAMAPQPQLSDADALTLASWILKGAR